MVGVGLLWFLEKVPSGAIVNSSVPSSLPRTPSQILNTDSHSIDEGFLGLLGGSIVQSLHLMCDGRAVATEIPVSF